MLLLLINILVSLVFAFIFALITHFLSKKLILDRESMSPFECGFSTKEESRFPFSLRFFLVALIFLIFDVELLMLFPYVSCLIYSSSFITLIIYSSFLIILSLGLYYEWNNMMLEWVN